MIPINKIQLVFPPSGVGGVGFEGCFVPNGLLSIASFLKRKFNHRLEVEVIDGSVTPLESMKGKPGIFELIENGSADLVGVSALTGNYNAAKKILKRAHENGAKTVIGNHHAKYLYKKVSEDFFFPVDDVDFIIEGERGEFSFAELIFNLNHGHPLDGISSLAYAEQGGFFVNSSRGGYPRLEHLEPPDLSFIKDFHPYFKVHEKIFKTFNPPGESVRQININNVKGCLRGVRGACIYCCLKDHKSCFLEPEGYWKRISALTEMDFNYIFETCNSLSSLDEIGRHSPRGSYLKRLVEAKPESIDPKMMVYANAFEITEDVVEYFLRMNVHRVIFGFDSGDSEILRKGIKKGETTSSQNIRAAELLNDAKIQIYGCYVPGAQGETSETMAHTYDQMMAMMELPYTSVLEYTSLAPMPGSEAWRLIENTFEEKFGKTDAVDVPEIAKLWVDSQVPGVTWEEIEGYKYKLQKEAEKRGIIFGGYY
jgi:radical SAM superfamily enzyme YgiQ (UPF0313 family)